MSSTRRRLGVLSTCGLVVAVLALPGAARAAAPTCDDIGAADDPQVVIAGNPATAPIPCADADPGDTLTIAIVSPPQHGDVVDNHDGTATYTPAGGFSGPDQFTFKANDGTSDSNVATAFLEIDTPPTCTDNHKTVQQGRSLVISFDNDFPCNDIDAPDTLGIGFDSDPAHGTLTDDPAHNAEIYTPAPGFTGTDSFLYFAEDEWQVDSDDATMAITVTPKPVATPTPTPTPTPRPDTTPPAVGLRHARQTIRNARAKGVGLTVTSSEAGTLAVVVSVDKRTARRLKARRVVGTLTRTIGAGQSTVRIRLSAKARKALKRLRKVKLAIAATVTDAAGNKTAKTLRVKLRR